MKRLYIIIVFITSTLAGFAYDVVVDGIAYNLNRTIKTAEVTEGGDYSGAVRIPRNITVGGVEYSVTSIRILAFRNCQNLTAVEIPITVRSIGNFAFNGCVNLISVIIPHAVTSIGDCAFRGCNRLTYISIPNTVKSIGESAFDDCSSLTSVTIPNSVNSMGKYAFYGCRKLTSLTIGNSVSTINPSTFAFCSDLTSVTIPSSVTSIGENAFRGCSSLTSVTIPYSVTRIGDNAFSGCSSLTTLNYNAKNATVSTSPSSPLFPNTITTLTIGDQVESIPAYFVQGCSGLTSVTIPNSVMSIGENAFSGCSGLPVVDNVRYADTYIVEAVNKSLSSHSIKEGTRFIGENAFNGCSGLTSVTIPNSVTNIGNGAFYGCTNLASVTIPESVEVIGSNTFNNCSTLVSVTIPKNVTSIGSSAFSGCTGLKSIYSKNPTPPAADNTAFTNIKVSKCKLYVPEGSREAYYWADVWKDFYNIIEITTTVELTPGTNVLNLTDANPTLSPGLYGVNNISYSRNISENKYATFCLPFDINLSDYADYYSKVYVPLNNGLLKPDGTLILMLESRTMTETVPAGTPFLAYGRTNGTVVFKNKQVTEITPDMPAPEPINLSIYNFSGTSGTLNQNTDVEVKIGGTYKKLTGLSSDHYRAFTTSGTFGPAEWLNPFRVYVYKDDGQAGVRIANISLSMDDDETTLIERIKGESKQSSQYIYNIQGQRVSSPQGSGLYIINGKKVIK